MISPAFTTDGPRGRFQKSFLVGSRTTLITPPPQQILYKQYRVFTIFAVAFGNVGKFPTADCRTNNGDADGAHECRILNRQCYRFDTEDDLGVAHAAHRTSQIDAGSGSSGALAVALDRHDTERRFALLLFRIGRVILWITARTTRTLARRAATAVWRAPKVKLSTDPSRWMRCTCSSAQEGRSADRDAAAVLPIIFAANDKTYPVWRSTNMRMLSEK